MATEKYRVNPPLAIMILTWLLAIVGVLRLVGWVREQPVIGLDQRISLFIQRQLAGNDALMEAISVIGVSPQSIMFILLAAACLWLGGLRRAAVVSLLVVGGSAVSYVGKIWVNRPRPTDELVRVIQHVDDPSFPSGHVIMYTILFGFLIFVMLMNKRIPMILRTVVMVASLFLVLSVGLSRIYLGVHWATDIMGGYLIGLSVLSVMIYLYSNTHIFPRLADDFQS
jgi:membrane-associated phospholipid phosphatase